MDRLAHSNLLYLVGLYGTKKKHLLHLHELWQRLPPSVQRDEGIAHCWSVLCETTKQLDNVKAILRCVKPKCIGRMQNVQSTTSYPVSGVELFGTHPPL